MKKEVKNLIVAANAALESGDKMAANKSLRDILAVLEEEPNPQKKWWVIVLKVLAYLIGLLLAGVGTANAATLLIN